MKAVILAGGKGERMKPLTLDRPKALVELKSKPLLRWVLESFEQVELEGIGIVYGQQGDLIKKKFGKTYRRTPVKYIEQKQPLGTAHAVLQAKKFTGDDNFIVVNSDVIIDREDMRRLSDAKNSQCIVMARKSRKPQKFGVLSVDGNRLLGVEEKPERPKSNLILAGAFLFGPKFFDELYKVKLSKRNEFEITEAINAMAKKGHASFVECKKKTLDIGTPEDLKRAQGL